MPMLHVKTDSLRKDDVAEVETPLETVTLNLL
jgi:hypothetical protein